MAKDAAVVLADFEGTRFEEATSELRARRSPRQLRHGHVTGADTGLHGDRLLATEVQTQTRHPSPEEIDGDGIAHGAPDDVRTDSDAAKREVADRETARRDAADRDTADRDTAQRGTANGCQLSGDTVLDSPDVLSLRGRRDQDGFSQRAMFGDFDGDGSEDVAVSAFGGDLGASDGGSVHVFFGPIEADRDVVDADRSLLGETEGAWAGWHAGSGDFDGDGVDDLMVAAPWNWASNDHTGRGYLVLGGPSGTSSLADADGVWRPNEGTEGFASGAAVVGDVNGDGLADVLFASQHDDTSGTNMGAAWLVHGPGTGHHGAAEADGRLYGTGRAGDFGKAVGPAGDVNGDGLADFLVFGRTADRGKHALLLFEGPASGAAYADEAVAAFARADGDPIVDDRSQLLGSDLDGDGYSDVVAGTVWDWQNESGEVYIWYAPAPGLHDDVLADATLLGEDTGDTFGWWTSAPGDLDGDGTTELLIGAPQVARYGTGSGADYLVYGPFSGTRTVGADDARFFGSRQGATVGWSNAGGSDVTGDGLPDLLLGATYDHGMEDDSGVLWIVSGSGI